MRENKTEDKESKVTLNEQLMEAAKNGQTETVITLLKEGAEVDRTDQVGDTALIQAAINGHTKTVNALLERGAEVDRPGPVGDTSLMWAAQNGHTETVIALLKGGAKVDRPGPVGDTALIRAAVRGHTETVIALLEGGAEVDYFNHYGNTALMGTADKGDTETVNALLERGAEVDCTGQDGDTALIRAAINGHTKTVNALLVGRAEVDKPNLYGDTALIMAACRGSTEIVNSLLEGGAEVDWTAEDGETALIQGAINGQTETVIALLEGGAKVDRTDRRGNTAFKRAAARGHIEIIQLLYTYSKRLKKLQKMLSTSPITNPGNSESTQTQLMNQELVKRFSQILSTLPQAVSELILQYDGIKEMRSRMIEEVNTSFFKRQTLDDVLNRLSLPEQLSFYNLLPSLKSSTTPFNTQYLESIQTFLTQYDKRKHPVNQDGIQDIDSKRKFLKQIDELINNIKERLAKEQGPPDSPITSLQKQAKALLSSLDRKKVSVTKEIQTLIKANTTREESLKKEVINLGGGFIIEFRDLLMSGDEEFLRDTQGLFDNFTSKLQSQFPLEEDKESSRSTKDKSIIDKLKENAGKVKKDSKDQKDLQSKIEKLIEFLTTIDRLANSYEVERNDLDPIKLAIKACEDIGKRWGIKREDRGSEVAKVEDVEKRKDTLDEKGLSIESREQTESEYQEISAIEASMMTAALEQSLRDEEERKLTRQSNSNLETKEEGDRPVIIHDRSTEDSHSTETLDTPDTSPLSPILALSKKLHGNKGK